MSETSVVKRLIVMKESLAYGLSMIWNPTLTILGKFIEVTHKKVFHLYSFVYICLIIHCHSFGPGAYLNRSLEKLHVEPCAGC